MNRTRFLTALAAALVLTGCKEKPAAPAVAPPPAVVVAETVSGKASAAVNVIGEVVADQSVELVPRVDGFLQKRNFKEGDHVKAGDVLFEIEPDQYLADVSSAEAELERAKAACENADVEEERQKSMYENNATSRRDYDNARTIALERKANVRACEASLEQAKLNLSYTKISAPFSGRIGFASSDVGDMLTAKKGVLATVVSTDPVRVKFSLSELLMLKLTGVGGKNAMKDRERKVTVRLFFENGDEYPIKGDLRYWNNKVSATTGTIELQAVFPNPEDLLVPGMHVKVTLESSDAPDAVFVPEAAVQEDQLGKFVYVVRDGRVERRKVTTAPGKDGMETVLDGLSAGETVVVEGFQKIRNGYAVTVKTVAEREAERRSLMGGAAPRPAADAGSAHGTGAEAAGDVQ